MNDKEHVDLSTEVPAKTLIPGQDPNEVLLSDKEVEFDEEQEQPDHGVKKEGIDHDD